MCVFDACEQGTLKRIFPVEFLCPVLSTAHTHERTFKHYWLLFGKSLGIAIDPGLRTGWRSERSSIANAKLGGKTERKTTSPIASPLGQNGNGGMFFFLFECLRKDILQLLLLLLPPFSTQSCGRSSFSSEKIHSPTARSTSSVTVTGVFFPLHHLSACCSSRKRIRWSFC